MKGRSTRKSIKPNTVKKPSINSIADVLKSQKDSTKKDSSENLIIAFIRFSDDFLNAKNVSVATSLEKTSHKRRKEGTSGQNVTPIGRSVVIVNTDDNGTDKLPAVFVSSAQFEHDVENIQTTYQLTFEIESLPQQNGTPKKDSEEPPNKMQCINKQYHAEIPVFDKLGRNLLLNGLYHVTALEGPGLKSPRIATWETFPTKNEQHIADWAEEVNKYFFNEEDSNPFNTFDKTPKIQLYIEWTRNKTGSQYIPRPKFINDQTNNNKENTSTNNLPATNGVNGVHGGEMIKSESASKSFVFQFVVNNVYKQQTEERSDFMCPWCSLNCIRIYSLMKHLKLCHARFLFQYIDEGQKGRIDVYVNDNYDGSYSGAPHDVLIGSQRQPGPTRRNVVTNIMVFRSRRPTFKMSEFLEADDSEIDQQRQCISGHSRIYFHSETCIPIMPKELDYDSEGEPDPKWLQRTTKQMIDEFTDVNGGEKELMKLWNLHVMKHG
jgi:polycomb protein SUZ12